jgi:hypothetical protein
MIPWWFSLQTHHDPFKVTDAVFSLVLGNFKGYNPSMDVRMLIFRTICRQQIFKEFFKARR